MELRSSKAISRALSVGIIVIIAVAGVGAATYFVTQSTPGAPASAQTGGANNQHLINVTLGFQGPPDVTDTTGFILWQAAGQQVGLNIIPSYWGGNGALLNTALQTGKVQFAEDAPDQVLLPDQATGNSSGSYPFVLFGTYEATLDYSIVVSNNVTSWSQLANAPMAGNTPTATSSYYIHALETAHGIPANEQNVVNGGGETSRAAELLAGKVVGAIIEPFNTVKALSTGKFHIMAYVPQVLPDAVGEVLYTTWQFDQNNQPLVTKVEESMLIAARMAHNQTTFVNWVEQEFPGTNQTIAASAWKIWMAERFWDPNGGVTYPVFTTYENIYIQSGRFKNPFLDPKYWVDPVPLQNAISALGNYTGPAQGYANPNFKTIQVNLPGASLIGFGSGLTVGYSLPLLTVPTIPALLGYRVSSRG